MEREITRKALEGNPRPFDSLDGGFRDAGDRIGEIPDGFLEGSEELDRLPSLDEGGDASSFPKYSLDDLPEPDFPAPTDIFQAPSAGPHAKGTAEGARGLLSGLGLLSRSSRSRKICYVILSLLIVASGIGVTVHRAREKGGEARVERTVTRAIKRPIELQAYTEQTELIVLGETDKDKTLVSMRLEFVFPAENAYRSFQKDVVYYRDLAYQFTSKQRPAKNTQKGWQEIVEKKFLSHLKATRPQSGVHSVRIAHWERL